VSGRDKNVDALSMNQLRRVLKTLSKELNATKRVYFSYRGRVKCSRALPDHKAQLRALNELAKLHGFYPRRGERESGDWYDRSERPVINLVLHSAE
jgi:hypothetical protein